MKNRYTDTKILIPWEIKYQYGFFFSLLNTLKNSFQFSKKFGLEILKHGTLWNAFLYTLSIFLITYGFLTLVYMLTSVDELLKVFFFFSPLDINSPLRLEKFKSFLYIFPFIPSFLLILESILTSFFLFLILNFLLKDLGFLNKNIQERNVALQFNRILCFNFYSKGSYLLMVFPGIVFKLLSICFSIYLLSIFLSILVIKNIRIPFSIVLSILTSFLWINIFIKILKYFL